MIVWEMDPDPLDWVVMDPDPLDSEEMDPDPLDCVEMDPDPWDYRDLELVSGGVFMVAGSESELLGAGSKIELVPDPDPGL